MRTGTYPLMFIGRVYNSMRNGTYPLMFIGRVYNSLRNGTYPLMFTGRVYNSMRNGTYPLMFTGRVYNSLRNDTYPLMFIGRVYYTNNTLCEESRNIYKGTSILSLSVFSCFFTHYNFFFLCFLLPSFPKNISSDYNNGIANYFVVRPGYVTDIKLYFIYK